MNDRRQDVSAAPQVAESLTVNTRKFISLIALTMVASFVLYDEEPLRFNLVDLSPRFW